MNKRRFVLFLIVGLLTFLIGVTAAIVLGSFDPLERFSRHGRRHLTIPPQRLGSGCKTTASNDDYHYHYTRPRTADLRYTNKSLTPPPSSKIGPFEPDTHFEEESEALTPSTSSARR
ncbi:MAG TPA: hypothetical protein VF658_19715 [Pyrinomonadaceae bacterium]|jgi:hypothetical protein